MSNPNMTLTLTELTNQELITELEKRVQNGTLQVGTSADKVEEKTVSLLSTLNSKSLLFLVGLTVGFTFVVLSVITLTGNSATSYNLEFSEPNNQQIKIDLKN
jgi:hypothetical protein